MAAASGLLTPPAARATDVAIQFCNRGDVTAYVAHAFRSDLGWLINQGVRIAGWYEIRPGRCWFTWAADLQTHAFSFAAWIDGAYAPIMFQGLPRGGANDLDTICIPDPSARVAGGFDVTLPRNDASRCPAGHLKTEQVLNIRVSGRGRVTYDIAPRRAELAALALTPQERAARAEEERRRREREAAARERAEAALEARRRTIEDRGIDAFMRACFAGIGGTYRDRRMVTADICVCIYEIVASAGRVDLYDRLMAGFLDTFRPIATSRRVNVDERRLNDCWAQRNMNGPTIQRIARWRHSIGVPSGVPLPVRPRRSDGVDPVPPEKQAALAEAERMVQNWLRCPTSRPGVDPARCVSRAAR